MDETLLHPATERQLESIISGSGFGAYIFVGPQSIGKSTAAREVGQAISGHTSVTAGTDHPDFMIIEPDGQSIGIDQVSQLEHKLKLRAGNAQNRVVIMDEAHSLTNQAQNALLKTLEEPPANTAIFLICEQAHDLLPTIRSRAQIIRFQPPDKQEVAQHLLAELDVDRDRAHQAAEISGGMVGRARQIAKDENLIQQHTTQQQFAKKILTSSTYQRLIYAFKLVDSSDFQPEEFGRLLCVVIHRQLQELPPQAPQTTQWINAFQVATKFIYRIEANTNQKLAVFDLMLGLPRCSLE